MLPCVDDGMGKQLRGKSNATHGDSLPGRGRGLGRRMSGYTRLCKPRSNKVRGSQQYSRGNYSMPRSTRRARLPTDRRDRAGGSGAIMPPLPNLSGREAVRNFQRFGWNVARQRGSHIILTKQGEIATLSVPNHRRVSKGTLRTLIRSARLTVDEFCDAL